MNTIETRYLTHITTLDALKVPRADRVITFLLLLLLVIAVAVLRITPWVQTAYGDGVVSTVNPGQRTQAISALVP
ncbi:MAG: hypothetical protein MI746_03910, partial [Pseudomonadales bacterium]|nr:hypothetical protein [Pseudomonadales bacterium]